MTLTQDLFFSSQLASQILDHANNGINVVDINGILVYVNNISANYVNQTRENMIGKHISHFYPDAVLLTVLKNQLPVLDKKIHLVPPEIKDLRRQFLPYIFRWCIYGGIFHISGRARN